jgi:general secretion pathway protein G
MRCDKSTALQRRSAGIGRGQRAFTLIELVITVAIVAILAVGILPLAQVTMQRANEHELRTALQQLRQAIDAYKQASDEGRIPRRANESGYPRSLEVLVEGVEDAKDPDKSKIYFLRRIPRDPMSSDSGLRAHETWGLRSYASPPDQPAAGDDVFDVYSRSTGTGLNGVPYREW